MGSGVKAKGKEAGKEGDPTGKVIQWTLAKGVRLLTPPLVIPDAAETSFSVVCLRGERTQPCSPPVTHVPRTALMSPRSGSCVVVGGCHQVLGPLPSGLDKKLPRREASWAADGLCPGWMEPLLLPTRPGRDGGQTSLTAVRWQNRGSRMPRRSGFRKQPNESGNHVRRSVSSFSWSDGYTVASTPPRSAAAYGHPICTGSPTLPLLWPSYLASPAHALVVGPPRSRVVQTPLLRGPTCLSSRLTSRLHQTSQRAGLGGPRALYLRPGVPRAVRQCVWLVPIFN